MTRERLERLKILYADSVIHPDIWALIVALESAWAERDTILNNHKNPSTFLTVGKEIELP